MGVAAAAPAAAAGFGFAVDMEKREEPQLSTMNCWISDTPPYPDCIFSLFLSVLCLQVLLCFCESIGNASPFVSAIEVEGDLQDPLPLLYLSQLNASPFVAAIVAEGNLQDPLPLLYLSFNSAAESTRPRRSQMGRLNKWYRGDAS